MPATIARPGPFKQAGRSNSTPRVDSKPGPKPEPTILFQKFFKSVGPRTYAAQVKEAANGNHFVSAACQVQCDFQIDSPLTMRANETMSGNYDRR